MTYNDIIEWIKENYDFETNEDPRAAFNQISEDWNDEEEGNRDTLANTLGANQIEPFIERIKKLIPQTDETLTEFGQIIRGAESVVLPQGFTEVITEVIEETGFELNDTLQGIVNFFKRLFR